MTDFFLFDSFSPGNMRYKKIGKWVHSYTKAQLHGYTFVKRGKQVFPVPKSDGKINGWIVKPYGTVGSYNIRTVMDEALKVGENCTRVTVYQLETPVFLYTWKANTLPGEHIIGENNFSLFQGAA